MLMPGQFDHHYSAFATKLFNFLLQVFCPPSHKAPESPCDRESSCTNPDSSRKSILKPVAGRALPNALPTSSYRPPTAIALGLRPYKRQIPCRCDSDSRANQPGQTPAYPPMGRNSSPTFPVHPARSDFRIVREVFTRKRPIFLSSPYSSGNSNNARRALRLYMFYPARRIVSSVPYISLACNTPNNSVSSSAGMPAPLTRPRNTATWPRSR